MGRKPYPFLCKECGEIDPEMFYSYAKSHCKSCVIKKTKAYQLENKGKVNEKNNKRRLKNR